MRFELKTLSSGAVPRALAKAERFRLLNEPGEAESICLDALEVDPDNQQALVMLVLALSDQLGDGKGSVVGEALRLVARLRDDYERAYYAGLISERRAKAQLARNTPGCGSRAFASLREAMTWYERAEPSGRPATTMRYSGGTPAPASSCDTSPLARPPKSGASSCSWSKSLRKKTRYPCS